MTADDPTAPRFICRHGMWRTEHWCDDHADHGADAALAAADAATPARTLPDRDTIERALSEVLWNASNYPNPSAVLGRSIEPLRTKAVNAVMAALADQSTAEDREDDDRLLDRRMADLLTRTANALKGDPAPLVSHGWDDLPDAAARAVAEARAQALGDVVRRIRAVYDLQCRNLDRDHFEDGDYGDGAYTAHRWWSRAARERGGRDA